MDIKVEFLPKGIKDPLFEQRESGRAHTPYAMEKYFYGCIREGDEGAVKAVINLFLDNALVVGRMSNDNLMQAKYFAVSCITLATRYAIEGGLEESVAYNLSDSYVMNIDGLGSEKEITEFLTEKALELAVLVKRSKIGLQYAPYVRKTIKYIDAHLHEKIRIDDLAVECGVSYDYLSAEFKKQTGEGLSRYIARKKLEEAKKLLAKGEYNCGEIAYILGFCAESHFITQFKKFYGVTPKQYLKTL